ncbi:glycosyl hydrolase family 18 protein [Flavobacterium lipolyticum]|uniref:chitinase n=1 Tax=Flavobacterium lipolyticum TaxID=2893754 RepID=A0ABS8LXE6_9FLAO|nr:glycosyl hydrolase family 18 protein [Flavobacterium sp. F-126]MCC9017242.1 T9SS sorting signal type C domain-containing protein [Flavobacterium sp. F-126]
MKQYYLLFLFSVLFPTLLFSQPSHNKKVVGYYAQWAIYGRDFNVSKIDGSKLTHLNYSFYGTSYDPARPENTKLQCLDTYADFEHMEDGIPWDAPVKGNFYGLMKLKEKYPHLKVLISVGGWTKGQDLSPIAASPVARAALAADMVKFIATYPFIDGFDIDWEYPLSGGTDGTEILNGAPVPPQKYSPDDNKNLVYLLKAMRQAMPNKLITIAAGNNVRNVSKQYLGPNNRAQFGMTEDISTYCDYITFFGYDFGGNWFDKTCYNAPLYASGNTNDPFYGAEQSESLDELTTQYLNVVGFPANKLIMGLPFYGKKFDHVANNGTNPNLPGLFVAAPRDVLSACKNPQPPLGTWDTGSPCENSGSIEICDLVGNSVTTPHPYLDPNTMMVTPKAASAGWVRYWDNTTKVPYLYNSTLKQFISYEDKQSMDLKAKYITSKNLAGGMVWELSQDTRGAVPNALLNQIDASFKVAVEGTLTISGTAKMGTNLVSDVTVQLKDENDAVIQTVKSSDGNFTFTKVVSGANYAVTALKVSYTFTPVKLTNVTANQTGIVIQGTQPLYTITGTVLNGITAVSGVTVTVASATANVTGVSDSKGAYRISGLTAGADYTITAAKTGMTFSPVSTLYSALSENKVLDFNQNATPTNKISGMVKNGSVPIAGAKIELNLPWTDSTHPYATFVATTDAYGKYSFDNAIFSGYTTISSLKMNAWDNNSVVYYPTDLANLPIPVSSKEYNFNSSAAAPQVTITSPSAANLTIVPGAVIQLKANGSMTTDDGKITIASVVFNVNGLNITGTPTTGIEYTATWTPAVADFNKNYTLKATATASNNATAENSFPFYLQCSGTACPNVLPEITWLTPASNTVNQASGFQPVSISVNVTDRDGTISSVAVNVNGTYFPMIKGSGDTYSYTFTPSSYKEYPIIVKAIDNKGGENLLNQSITIVNSKFNPLPAKVIVGYAHGWENTSAPFLYFRQIADKKYNVVVYSFIETVNRDGYTPVLVVNEPRFFTNGVFDPQLLKNDIKSLRDKGIPVIVSIGGQNGHVVLNTINQKNIFVNGIKAIVDQYNFDGVDIDFEGGSMNFGAGALKDFSYSAISAYPKLKNVIDAFKELKAYYGTGFILTAAPETYYVQVGYSVYGDGAGSFLPVIHNLRNELDLLMVQLYNTGSLNALDNTAYSQATPDFLVAMSDMLMKGFNVASTGFYFPPLPASKIVIAIPACPGAAPAGGYLTPDKGIDAFNYLRFGTTYSGRKYTMKSSLQPQMRGVMTWSINWDASCGSGYEFSNKYHDYFSKSLSVDHFDKTGDKNIIAHFKNNVLEIAVHNEATEIDHVEVYNILGQSVLSYKNSQNHRNLWLEDRSFLTKQLFIVVITDNLGQRKSYKLVNF